MPRIDPVSQRLEEHTLLSEFEQIPFLAEHVMMISHPSRLALRARFQPVHGVADAPSFTRLSAPLTSALKRLLAAVEIGAC